MKDDGFWIIENVLTGVECDALITTLSLPIAKHSRAGIRHLMASYDIAVLASDPRLLRIARLALSDGAIPYRATLFEKSGRSNWLVVWHQDTALPLESRNTSSEWGPWSTKESMLYAHAPTWALDRIVALRVYLDDSTTENGPLRVIPGTHREGVLSDKEIFQIARREGSTECIVGRGGVVAMRPLLIHSSSKGRDGKPRRVLHIEYAVSLELEPGVHLAVA